VRNAHFQEAIHEALLAVLGQGRYRLDNRLLYYRWLLVNFLQDKLADLNEHIIEYVVTRVAQKNLQREDVPVNHLLVLAAQRALDRLVEPPKLLVLEKNC